MQWRPTRRNTIKLRLVEPPSKSTPVITAPPAVYFEGSATQYVCGNCATLLATSGRKKIKPLILKCRECGAHNALES